MNKQHTSKSTLFLMELVLVIFFFYLRGNLRQCVWLWPNDG